jgi:hypothetical protein
VGSMEKANLLKRELQELGEQEQPEAESKKSA